MSKKRHNGHNGNGHLNGNGHQNHSLVLNRVSPITENQRTVFSAFNAERNLILHGYPGTGKTFLAFYLTLQRVLRGERNKIYIVRSIVPTREIGYLPGKIQDKIKVYEAPYKNICTELFERGDAYDILKQKGIIEFMSTSYMRGVTFRDCYIIVDEPQNLSYHELDSIITRVGEHCNIIFSGDFRQTDLKGEEKAGFSDFLNIITKMKSFFFVEFGIEDIVRSGLVKDYIIKKVEQRGL